MELRSQNENIQHTIAKYTKEEQKLDSEMKKWYFIFNLN